MITKAYIERGIGDALNARDFLITYCKQKNLKQDEITVYTRIHKNIFKDTNFKIKDISDVNYKSLTYYANFGEFDLEKKFISRDYDLTISKNAGINYDFNTIIPIDIKEDISDIKLPTKFVTINYGHDNNVDKNLKCLKMWPYEYWVKLVSLLKEHNIDCVQIGAGWSCRDIEGVKLNLVNKLTLEQSGEIMKKALFHIDIEGGLVIFAKHINVKSVVLFTSTDINQFSRVGNLNLRNTDCLACSGSLNKSRLNTVLYAKKFPCRAKNIDGINKCAKQLTSNFVMEKIIENKWI